MPTPAASIRCHDLAVGYNGSPVLKGLRFKVHPGETVALVGKSGCGKTTLLKTLAGILEPLTGEATVLGSRLPTAPPAGKLGYIPQSLGLVKHETALRNVLHGTLSEMGTFRSCLGLFPARTEAKARDALAQVGLEDLDQKRVKELSGGQQRRVAIARAIVQRPDVLLADEILSELDVETAQSVIESLHVLQRDQDMTVLIVEHDLDVAWEISDKLIRLESGGIQERIESTPSSVQTRSRLHATS